MASLKNALGLQELTDKRSNLIRSLISEFFGTMLLNFFGCGAVVTNNVVAISLSFGLIVAGAIQAIGHVSGGHINPAVTFGLLAIGKISVIRAVLYVLVQSAGAIVGSITLKALSADSMESSLGDVKLADGMEPIQGFGIELFLGLILVLVVCGACDPGKPESKGIAPLIIGLAVTVGHIVAIPRTGSGMNPARALGSAVVKGEYMNHWVYWIGPIIGGIIGSLIYTHVIGRNNNTNSSRSYNTVATDEKELQQLSARSKGAQSA